jgi:hypothetical protein
LDEATEHARSPSALADLFGVDKEFVQGVLSSAEVDEVPASDVPVAPEKLTLLNRPLIDNWLKQDIHTALPKAD